MNKEEENPLRRLAQFADAHRTEFEKFQDEPSLMIGLVEHMSFRHAALYGAVGGAVPFGLAGAGLGTVFGAVALPLAGAWGGHHIVQSFTQAAGTPYPIVGAIIGGVTALALGKFKLWEKTKEKTTTTYTVGKETIPSSVVGDVERVVIKVTDINNLSKTVEHEVTRDPYSVSDATVDFCTVSAGIAAAFIGAVGGVTLAVGTKVVAHGAYALNKITDNYFLKQELRAAMRDNLNEYTFPAQANLQYGVTTYVSKVKTRAQVANVAPAASTAAPSNKAPAGGTYQHTNADGYTLH